MQRTLTDVENDGEYDFLICLQQLYKWKGLSITKKCIAYQIEQNTVSSSRYVVCLIFNGFEFLLS